MDDYQGGILGVEALKNSGQARIPLSRKEKIQAELKLLEWHKMANAAAIKSALIQTKSLNDQASAQQASVRPNYTEDDEKWIKKVIQQEHIKPLEVSKDFVLEYERRERENNDRLTHQVERHIDTLKSLRQKLEARHDLKVRQEEYRNWQREFLPKKHAVMLGKTLDEVDTAKRSPTTHDPDSDIRDDLMAKSLNKDKHKSSQELNAVLDSLSRLADLENRISSLEKDNRHDQLKQLEKPTANQRTAFEFRKKRGDVTSSSAISQQNASSTGPVGLMYEIRSKHPGNDLNASWKVQLPSGAGSMAVKAKHAHKSGAYDDDFENDEDESSVERGAGVFITAQSSTDRLKIDKDAARRERQRNQALAPAGMKNLRARVQQRKTKEKEQAIGQRRHEEAMKEMAKRKQEQMQKKTGVNAAALNAKKIQAPTRGMASGIKTKNKHMQEFEKMKAGHNKRREDFNKKPAGKPGIEKRFISQTAPTYGSKVNANLTAANARAGRMPSSKPSVPVTRRAEQVPIKRQPGSAPPPSTKTAPPIPSIAVTGMGGLRAIKAGMYRQPQPPQQGIGRNKR